MHEAAASERGVTARSRRWCAWIAAMGSIACWQTLMALQSRACSRSQGGGTAMCTRRRRRSAA